MPRSGLPGHLAPAAADGEGEQPVLLVLVDRQTPAELSRLLERGHADVVELQTGRGEWFCALAWAPVLGEQGREADALETLAP
ncbi:hypothetical protein ACIBCM_06450 [Streptomyces sp. NPDC051018]|uniref:hypothetical protein n=1 Tax=Streptomyces sp. NPDC051018 TaxID=3365639 RepID=UPI003792DD17